MAAACHIPHLAIEHAVSRAYGSGSAPVAVREGLGNAIADHGFGIGRTIRVRHATDEKGRL
jgi:hypothetical protein